LEREVKMHPFENALSVSKEDVELELRSIREVHWSDFLLNPRRLRGSDFLMRWSQGVWSEKRIIEAVNESGEFWAVPYGPSGTAPSEDVREFELYFEKLERAGLGNVKRPDILVFGIKDKHFVDNFLKQIGGVSELPFISEDKLQGLIQKARLAVECETSLWVAEKMPDYGATLVPQKRLNGRPGLKKTAVVPTVIVKEEDRAPLKTWQRIRGVPIHIWHVFFDRAFGISLDEVERLIRAKLILPTVQTFQAPGGATTKKIIYKIYYQYAYLLGNSAERPKLVPDFVQDKNGHILPYVRFEGGSLKLSQEALNALRKLSRGI
jgi:hypothetical protein